MTLHRKYYIAIFFLVVAIIGAILIGLSTRYKKDENKKKDKNMLIAGVVMLVVGFFGIVISIRYKN
jgi:cell division protein FtsW (lipid II flippase)